MPFYNNKIVNDFTTRVEYKQEKLRTISRKQDSQSLPEKIITLPPPPPQPEPIKIVPYIVYQKKTPVPINAVAKSEPMIQYQAITETSTPPGTSGGVFSPNLETFTSKGNSYFAIKADIPDVANWSLYPAISTVNMNNNSIINGDTTSFSSTITQWLNLDGNILTTSSGAEPDLLLNGVPIATVSSITAIEDWSLYPQISTVNGNNNNYIGLNNISTNTITVDAITASTINGVVFPQPIPPSMWISTATSALDMSGYGITNVSSLSGVSTINGLSFPFPSAWVSTATSALDMSGYGITNVSSLSGVSTINGTQYPPPSVDITTWANFPAISTVQIPNHDLQMTTTTPGISYNTATINANVNIGNLSNAPLRPDFNAFCGSFNVGDVASPATTVNITSLGNVNIQGGGGVSIAGGGGVAVTGVGAVAVTGVGGVVVSGGGAVSINGTGGISIVGSGAIGVASGGILVSGGGVAITAGGLAINAGLTEIGTLALPGGGLNIYASNLNMIPIGPTTSELNTNNINAYTPNSLAITGVSTINGSPYPPTAGSAVNFSYNLYVSNISGSDTAGDGKISNPYQTITKALAVANTIADTNPVIINLACGTYTENITISRNNTYITGGSTSLSSATVINGSVTIDMTSSSLFIVVGGLSSVQVTNIVYNNAVAKNQNYVLTDCIVVPGTGVSGIALTDTSVGGNGSMTVQNSLIYMSDTTAVTVSNCRISFINTQITNNPGLANATVSVIVTSGTGGVNMFGSSIIQNSTASTVQPLINITNNVATGAVMTFNNAILQYTSATSDAGTGAKCCIRLSNSAAVTSIVMIYNYLICQGATTTNGTPGQFLCVQRTGAGTAGILYGNNLGGTTANHFPTAGGGFTKTAYVTVA